MSSGDMIDPSNCIEWYKCSTDRARSRLGVACSRIECSSIKVVGLQVVVESMTTTNVARLLQSKYFPYPLPTPLSFWNIDYERIKTKQPLFLRQGRKPVTQVMVELWLLDGLMH
jgi:hypothetical protein